MKYLRKEPAIIPLEALSPQADPRTEPIMSWLDLTDLDQNEDRRESEETPISTSELTESTNKETLPNIAFERVIAELFDIPKEQIPTTQKSMDLALDLPELSLTPLDPTMQVAFSFLDYLLDQNNI